MKILSTLSILFFVGCTSPNGKQIRPENTSESKIIDANFPLFLDAIDFENPQKTVEVNDEIESRISKTALDFYESECDLETRKMFAFEKCHLGTIRLPEKKHTLYVLLLKGFPTNDLICKILVYDNAKKRFLGNPIDFKIYALYDDLKAGKLVPSNLKREFEINTPEVQLIDLEGDGTHEFKFTRLFHNGTFNAINTQILKVENDELRLSETVRGIGKYSQNDIGTK